jgi:hypothetical protein
MERRREQIRPPVERRITSVVEAPVRDFAAGLAPQLDVGDAADALAQAQGFSGPFGADETALRAFFGVALGHSQRHDRPGVRRGRVAALQDIDAQFYLGPMMIYAGADLRRTARLPRFTSVHSTHILYACPAGQGTGLSQAALLAEAVDVLIPLAQQQINTQRRQQQLPEHTGNFLRLSVLGADGRVRSYWPYDNYASYCAPAWGRYRW